MTDGSNTRAAFKSQEVTEEVLMRVLSVYPVRPSRQPMNNRHCGSILWILNQWHWERGLGKHIWQPGVGGGLRRGRKYYGFSICISGLKKQAISIDAAHFCAGVFSFPGMTNRLFVRFWRFVQRGSCEGALLAPDPAYQWVPCWDIEHGWSWNRYVDFYIQ